MSRYRLPSDFDTSALAASIAHGHQLVMGRPNVLTTTYLDTFDWRLWGDGLVLVEECDSDRRLVLLEYDRLPHVVAIGSTPRTPDDLPPGHLADRIGPLLGLRTLMPVGAAHIRRRDGRIQGGEGEMLALVRLEEMMPLDHECHPTGSGSTTLDLRSGSPKTFLEQTKDLATTADHDLGFVTAVRDRSPGDYSSKLRISLEPGQPSASALRVILLELLNALEANIEGTIDDLDTEFLHDLRVASRRTRSALTQLPGVLPAAVVAPFNTEFKWLGNVTGPLRDLDVYLLEMPAYRAALPDHLSANLNPLEDLIVADRDRTHRSVVRALRSQRFKNLVAGWRRSLEDAESEIAGNGARATSELAAKRISKATRRILKRGSGLGADPPAEALHRLRIDAKKLRYLLEFFRSLYPERRISARIKELKRLQDILGGFNDMEVQRLRLADFARELHTDPAVGTSCILTLGRLAGILEERQEDFRLAFDDAFREFSSRPVQAAFKSLVGGKESM